MSEVDRIRNRLNRILANIENLPNMGDIGSRGRQLITSQKQVVRCVRRAIESGLYPWLQDVDTVTGGLVWVWKRIVLAIEQRSPGDTPFIGDIARYEGDQGVMRYEDGDQLAWESHAAAVVSVLLDELPDVSEDVQTPIHNADFTMVDWYGTIYEFRLGVKSQVVQALWEEWEKTGLGLQQQTIRGTVDSGRDKFRVDDAFRNHPALGTMIQRCGDGRYKLTPPDGDKPTATT